jgi:hypothetical protein
MEEITRSFRSNTENDTKPAMRRSTSSNIMPFYLKTSLLELEDNEELEQSLDQLRRVFKKEYPNYCIEGS